MVDAADWRDRPLSVSCCGRSPLPSGSPDSRLYRREGSGVVREGKGCLGFAACLPILMFGDGNEIMNRSCYRVARPLACEILVMPVR